mmetsp:Transcript_36236/g.86737  ORF Transcript_36236/g.86737 Transcript_36236/m.86737 type:complete len:131 (+) Transcript_36236:53-445(+)
MSPPSFAPPTRRRGGVKQRSPPLRVPCAGSLQVVGLGGFLCTVEVDLAASVWEAQLAIAKTAGIPAREQSLLCQERRLASSELLQDALAGEHEVTLVRCDAKVLAMKAALRTGATALERARRLAEKHMEK